MLFSENINLFNERKRLTDMITIAIPRYAL